MTSYLEKAAAWTKPMVMVVLLPCSQAACRRGLLIAACGCALNYIRRTFRSFLHRGMAILSRITWHACMHGVRE